MFGSPPSKSTTNSMIMDPSSTATRENKQSTSLISESPPGTPIHIPIGGPPVTPPTSTHDDCDSGNPRPLTPSSSTCETHHQSRLPIPPTIPSFVSPFSIPWIVEEDGAYVDLTPSQPTIVVEQSNVSFPPTNISIGSELSV